jgi:hypothetical protein
VHALTPDQLSLFVLRLRDRVRSRAAAPPPLVLPDDIEVDQLSDGAVEELLAQLLAAGGEAAAAVAPAKPKAESVDVDELSDDEVAMMLTTLLQEETE